MKNLKALSLTCAIAVSACVGAVMPAQAVTVTVSTSDAQLQPGVDNQGFWTSATPNGNPVNDNYITGTYNGEVFRSFFSFALSGLRGTVMSARFDVRRYFPASDVALGLWDVSTPASELIKTRTSVPNDTIYADLAGGVSYGVFDVVAGGHADILSFVLNAGALRDINAAIGSGYFSIGAAVQGDGLIFAASGEEPGNSGNSSNGIQNLVLEIEPAVGEVPEPASIVLVGLGLAGLAGCRKRA